MLFVFSLSVLAMLQYGQSAVADYPVCFWFLRTLLICEISSSLESICLCSSTYTSSSKRWQSSAISSLWKVAYCNSTQVGAEVLLPFFFSTEYLNYCGSVGVCWFAVYAHTSSMYLVGPALLSKWSVLNWLWLGEFCSFSVYHSSKGQDGFHTLHIKLNQTCSSSIDSLKSKCSL